MIKKIIFICFILPTIYCQKLCADDLFSFSVLNMDDGFYTLSGVQEYKDDFSQINKKCVVDERSGAKFFNNCNNDCCWYVDINSANIKMGHNSRMIDLTCKEMQTGTGKGYNCYTKPYECKK